ncbi:hypothetical protein [Yoonia sp. BS5-3]|uniref:Uncharacterized protein n=1 Tax=Yoonia phaeophyticola TaxID=3137369 RepID=A0ABZ2UZV2_9RHOB
MEIPDQLWQIFATIVGGVISALVGFSAQRISERRSKNELLMRRLEEVYAHCQDLYDEHNTRINWLLGEDSVSKASFMAGPKHPGHVMSLVKMKVRSYAPNLTSSLDEMDQGHQALKAYFLNLEEAVLKGQTLVKETDYKTDELKAHLHTLGKGANEVKLGSVAKLQRYFG